PQAPRHLWAYLHPARSWPWYLLFGTTVFALGTVTTAVVLTLMPARAASPLNAQPCPAGVTAPVASCRRAA
ncbi:MAG TPA: hypothetical protein VGC80_04475, partial [Acetobacteraceae bacterium]